MKFLTESEKVALNWLKEKGYENIEKKEKIGMPDFVAGGKEFEVKKSITIVYVFLEIRLVASIIQI